MLLMPLSLATSPSCIPRVHDGDTSRMVTA